MVRTLYLLIVYRNTTTKVSNTNTTKLRRCDENIYIQLHIHDSPLNSAGAVNKM